MKRHDELAFEELRNLLDNKIEACAKCLDEPGFIDRFLRERGCVIISLVHGSSTKLEEGMLNLNL